MRLLLFCFTTMLIVISCGQNDKKQKDTAPAEKDTTVQQKQPDIKIEDTAVSKDTAAAMNTADTTAAKQEITLTPIPKNSKDIPAFKGAAVYLQSKQKADGSYLFVAKANEWGVININGKVEKLKFVDGYEDEAKYSNANYELTYSLDYRKAAPVENPTVETIIRIKGKGLKPYHNKVWGVWGER